MKETFTFHIKYLSLPQISCFIPSSRDFHLKCHFHGHYWQLMKFGPSHLMDDLVSYVTNESVSRPTFVVILSQRFFFPSLESCIRMWGRGKRATTVTAMSTTTATVVKSLNGHTLKISQPQRQQQERTPIIIGVLKQRAWKKLPRVESFPKGKKSTLFCFAAIYNLLGFRFPLFPSTHFNRACEKEIKVGV